MSNGCGALALQTSIFNQVLKYIIMVLSAYSKMYLEIKQTILEFKVQCDINLDRIKTIWQIYVVKFLLVSD